LYFMLTPKLAVALSRRCCYHHNGWHSARVDTPAASVHQFPILSHYQCIHRRQTVGFRVWRGIIEEATKALPIWWLYLHKRNVDSLSTVFPGLRLGFAFGIAEGTGYSISYALVCLSGVWFWRLPHPSVRSTHNAAVATCGVGRCFRLFHCIGSVNRHVEKGLLLRGWQRQRCCTGYTTPSVVRWLALDCSALDSHLCCVLPFLASSQAKLSRFFSRCQSTPGAGSDGGKPHYKRRSRSMIYSEAARGLSGIPHQTRTRSFGARYSFCEGCNGKHHTRRPRSGPYRRGTGRERGRRWRSASAMRHRVPGAPTLAEADEERDRR